VSKERELLKKVVQITYKGNSLPIMSLSLYFEIMDYLDQPEEKREPLSEEALLDVYKTLYQANPKVNVKKSQKRTECFEFARAIEKAHKIG